MTTEQASIETPKVEDPKPSEATTTNVIHHSVPWIMISGDQGMGKTTLAASGTGGYCLDADGRSFIFPPSHRRNFTYGPKMFEEIHGFVKLLLVKGVRTQTGIKVSGKDGEKEIRYLVIDTYDTLQKVLITRYLEQKGKPNTTAAISAPTMDMKDWGIILNYQQPFLMDLMLLRIPIVMCAHTKETDPIYNQFQKLVRPGKIDFAIAGAISGNIMNLVTYGLFIHESPSGGRMIRASKALVYDSNVTTTKDGGRLFVKKDQHEYAIDAQTGMSKHKWIDHILSHHSYDPSEKV